MCTPQWAACKHASAPTASACQQPQVSSPLAPSHTALTAPPARSSTTRRKPGSPSHAAARCSPLLPAALAAHSLGRLGTRCCRLGIVLQKVQGRLWLTAFCMLHANKPPVACMSCGCPGSPASFSTCCLRHTSAQYNPGHLFQQLLAQHLRVSLVGALRQHVLALQLSHGCQPAAQMELVPECT